MPDFYVVDATGARKLTTFGSGANLPDPVTVPHGGTGLITVAKGDLLYASATNILSRLPIVSTGLRVLTNAGDVTNTTPQWDDPTSFSVVPRPVIYKSAWSIATLQVTTPISVIWALTVVGNTAIVDTFARWIRFTTGAVAGNQAGFVTTAAIMWLDHAPTLEIKFRTGASLANVRLFFFISNAGAAFPANSDALQALKGVGIRYSTVAGDTGFMPWTADGTTQTIGTVIAPIAASTIYSLKIVVAPGGASASMSINGGTPQTVAIGAAALGTNMFIQFCVTNTAAAAKIMDWTAIYSQWT